MTLNLLVLTPGPTQGRQVPVRTPQFLIGRDPDCRLRPASPLVSGRHCAILQRQGKVFVRDLGSTEGTFVNDSRLHGETELHDGDHLRVGPLLFAVELKARMSVGQPTLMPTKEAEPTADRASSKPPSDEDIAALLLSDEDDNGPLDEDELTPKPKS